VEKYVPLIRTYLIIAAVNGWAHNSCGGIGVSKLVPGYPWLQSSTTGGPLYLPQIGVAPFGYLLASPFLAALAAPMEPIFPYLAVSCIGSIIGIVMCQRPDRIPKHFVKKSACGWAHRFYGGDHRRHFYNGWGDAGIRFLIMDTVVVRSFALSLWFPDNISRSYGEFLSPLSWLWQFLALNGFATMFAMLIIYLVDWRGFGSEFSKLKLVRFVRRFGFIAFSNYNNQWLYYLGWIGVSLLLTGERRIKLDWNGTLLVLVVSLVLYYLVMWGWEKIKYLGSIEWMIGTLGAALTPTSWQPERLRNLKWYQKGQTRRTGKLLSG